MHCPELTFQILHVRSIDPVKHKLPVKSNCVDEISPRWPASVWMHLKQPRLCRQCRHSMQPVALWPAVQRAL